MKTLATRSLLVVLLALGAGACNELVDTTALPPIDGYTSWYRVDSTGRVPGHGDTYRIIYANDVAHAFGHAGSYQEGSVLVKEIRYLDDTGLPGDIRYIAVMRKLAEAPPGGELQGGWQFTRFQALGDDEIQGTTCWNQCHVQAPLDGTWFDYGQ